GSHPLLVALQVDGDRDGLIDAEGSISRHCLFHALPSLRTFQQRAHRAPPMAESHSRATCWGGDEHAGAPPGLAHSPDDHFNGDAVAGERTIVDPTAWSAHANGASERKLYEDRSLSAKLKPVQSAVSAGPEGAPTSAAHRKAAHIVAKSDS